MVIGVPKEIKSEEYRVGLTPEAVAACVKAGHRVLVETGAGAGSGYPDREYREAGAHLLPEAAEVYARADMVVKVKEPLRREWPLLREGQILFTYLHLAAAPGLARLLMRRGVTAIAYETVRLKDGGLPLLRPMSRVAGRMAVQVGAHYLERTQGGKGILLGGADGKQRGNVLVLGAGTVGSSAAEVAAAMGARVKVLGRDRERLAALKRRLPQVSVGLSTPAAVAREVPRADLLIGAAAIPGARTPRIVSRDLVARMGRGSVIVDVSVDQGGCVETTRPTSHTHPVYTVDGVIHYCVANMPGVVPRTSTQALVHATLPYVLRLANLGFEKAVARSPALRQGVNVHRGQIVHPALAQALGVPLGSL